MADVDEDAIQSRWSLLSCTSPFHGVAAGAGCWLAVSSAMANHRKWQFGRRWRHVFNGRSISSARPELNSSPPGGTWGALYQPEVVRFVTDCVNEAGWLGSSVWHVFWPMNGAMNGRLFVLFISQVSICTCWWSRRFRLTRSNWGSTPSSVGVSSSFTCSIARRCWSNIDPPPLSNGSNYSVDRSSFFPFKNGIRRRKRAANIKLFWFWLTKHLQRSVIRTLTRRPAQPSGGQWEKCAPGNTNRREIEWPVSLTSQNTEKCTSTADEVNFD